MEQDEAQRRAAALEALKSAEPANPQSFWERHGTKVVIAVALVLGLWLAARVVGSFVHSSVDETSRAADDLSRGLRR